MPYESQFKIVLFEPGPADMSVPSYWPIVMPVLAQWCTTMFSTVL
ncbi:MAG: hypothetical protein ABW061_00600 [Polyangiaceae bacterium]